MTHRVSCVLTQAFHGKGDAFVVRLGHTSVLDLAAVFIDSNELVGCNVLVARRLSDALVKSLEFLILVFYILILGRLGNLVFLRLL